MLKHLIYRDSFIYIYQKCLDDEIFAMKVVTMVASNTFSQLEISEQKIRRLFIGHIQHTYESMLGIISN